MPRPEVIVWEAGGESAAALRQLGNGKFAIERALQDTEIIELAKNNPFAICLWEVNLSNWEVRASQLAEFRRSLPDVLIVIAASDLPEAVTGLLLELGAALVVRDPLEVRWVLQLAERQKQDAPADIQAWRTIVQTPID